jgi:protein-disulfide isomerase
MSGRLLAAVAAGAIAFAAQQQGPVEGLAASPVRVVIYEDLQCPDCAVFRKMMDEKLLPRYGDKVAFVHRDFPLSKHAWSRKAAIAARFFHEKDPAVGVAWRRETMANLRTITPDNFNRTLGAFSEKHGIPAAAATAALDDARLARLVEDDFQDGVARGVSHTPTVLVNGAPFVETFTVEEISKGIDQALAEAK